MTLTSPLVSLFLSNWNLNIYCILAWKLHLVIKHDNDCYIFHESGLPLFSDIFLLLLYSVFGGGGWSWNHSGFTLRAFSFQGVPFNSRMWIQLNFTVDVRLKKDLHKLIQYSSVLGAVFIIILSGEKNLGRFLLYIYFGKWCRFFFFFKKEYMTWQKNVIAVGKPELGVTMYACDKRVYNKWKALIR